MNIETLKNNIYAFERQIIESGFLRDVTDSTRSLPQISDNIFSMREAAEKIKKALDKIHGGDLPGQLRQLFPEGYPEPFTESNFHEQIGKILEDTNIDQTEFYNALITALTNLQEKLEKNNESTDEIWAFINRYLTDTTGEAGSEEQAIAAIIFRDAASSGKLRNFGQELRRWNNCLHLYHQLLSNEPPREIEISGVQSGSIEVVVNLDVDVAKCLGEVFGFAWKALAAWAAYRAAVLPVLKGVPKNKALLEGEKAQEQLFLDNIKETVVTVITEQHKEAKKRDKAIGGDNPKKAIESMCELVTSHVTRENDFRILSLPDNGEEASDNEKGTEETSEPDVAEVLQESSAEARNMLASLEPEQKKLLLETYGESVSEQEDLQAGE